jgi:biotin carboxyl carrier protein
MRKAVVKIEGREWVVEIDDDGRARVGGADAGVEVVEAAPGVWLLRRGSEQTVAQVDGTGAKLTVDIRRPGGDPVLVRAEIADPRRAQAGAPARPSGDATAPVTIRSPIPGRVVKLLVRVDDRVSAGQTTVVLEAMKMENELRAPRAGRVAAINCAEGAAVEAGQDLVVLV